MRLDRPVLFELAFVLVGLGFLAALAIGSVRNAPVSSALTLDASTEGVQEGWAGLYVREQKIGYSVSRRAPREDGGLLMTERTTLKLVLMGRKNDIHLATDVAIGGDGRMDSLLAQVRTEVQGLPVTLRAEGRRSGRGMELDLLQGGAKLTTLQLDSVPAVPATLYRAVLARSPEPGSRVTVPYFSPLSLSNAEAVVTVVGREEATTPEGEVVEAFRLRVDNAGQQLEALVTADGDRLEEKELEGGLGMRVVAETREAALGEGWPEDAEDAVDLIALSSVPLSGKLPAGGRELTALTLEVRGPESLDALLEAAHAERWDPESRRLRIEVPNPNEAPSYTLPASERSLQHYTRSTTFAPADHPRIVRAAGEVLGDDLDARSASARLVRWVHRTLDKVPVAGVPSALEVLESKRGDCNEHTTLYTALARSVGIPTRMAAGVVYSEAIFADGAFYYHAWPEVWLGDRWVPVDPTFGQFPADATHLKLVEGPLDKQMELMAVIGRLGLTVVETE